MPSHHAAWLEYTGIANMMAGGCRTQIFTTAKGQANLNGNKLTISWAPAGYSYENLCNPSKNLKKTLPAQTENIPVYFEAYFDDKQLCLMRPDRVCMSRD